MKIDREKYLKPFLKEDCSLDCSVCNKGILEIENETYLSLPTESSKKVFDEISEPSVLENKFTAILRCSNKRCNEIGIISGDISIKCLSYDDDFNEVYSSMHNIRYVNPPIKIIHIPEQTPKDVGVLLNDSFGLFWLDPPSAGNKIRKVLERIMDEKQIKKEQLHNRIIGFGQIENEKYKEISEMLEGVKWLGNEGSHDEKLQKEDLLKAYEVIDFALDEIYARDKRRENAKNKSAKLKTDFEIKRNEN
jgi:hypothetical protein